MTLFPKKKIVKVLLFPLTQLLDVTGPISVFEAANRFLPKGAGYKVSVIGAESALIPTSSCVSIQAQGDIKSEALDDVDTLIVPGGSEAIPHAMNDQPTLNLVQRAYEAGIRVAAICTGSFVLAQAGILNGRKCTTHWGEFENFRRQFPDITLLTDVIFHTEDNIWSSAGVSTGIDMALAMVAEDFGSNISQKVAKNLVLYMARPGNQEQISEFLRSVPCQSDQLNELVRYIQTMPAENHEVMRMAERCNMSPRSFTRKFKKELGKTPAALVREVRVKRALFYLTNTDYHLKRIANLSGFSSCDVMRQSMNAVKKASA